MVALAGLSLLASCGAEAPTFAPGNIQVTSNPAGAAILLDGEATGLVTPATLTDLDAGLYEISVELANHLPDPEGVTLELRPLDTLTAEFTLSATGLTVPGPEGARIYVNGDDTGKVAPASIIGLEPGPITVSLTQDTYLFQPASTEVTIVLGQVTELTPDTFVRRSQRTVMVEGFANVSCLPCPQLTANLTALAAKPGFGPDRMIFLEFSVSWPELTDPFYLFNPTENSDRFTLYQVLGAPDLYVDGTKMADALDAPILETEVGWSLTQDPGFLIDVETGASFGDVPVTVTLNAPESIDLEGHILFVALYEDVITIDPAPGLNGQTEFHHVFRDRVDVPPDVGLLEGGTPKVFEMTLTRGPTSPDNFTVVAFVQRNVDRYILQAGSTAAERPSQ